MLRTIKKTREKTVKLNKRIDKKKKELKKPVVKKALKGGVLKAGKAKAIVKPGLTARELKYFNTLQNRINVRTDSSSKSAPACEIKALPEAYSRDLIIAQVRDPWWMHVYWQVMDATWSRLRKELKDLFDTAKRALRVYDVSKINFNGSNAHSFFDIEVPLNADNWYIDTVNAGRSWCIDFGLKLSGGRFITIVRSNIATTPLEGPSSVNEEEWAVGDDLFAKLYAHSVGMGSSLVKTKKPWLESGKRRISSGGISSLGFSPVKKIIDKQRKFWLVVNTELIVYGATEPDASVSVCGIPLALRADGTFSQRFSLPEGKIVIPVEAKSSDGIDKRVITPVVIRQTK